MAASRGLPDAPGYRVTGIHDPGPGGVLGDQVEIPVVVPADLVRVCPDGPGVAADVVLLKGQADELAVPDDDAASHFPAQLDERLHQGRARVGEGRVQGGTIAAQVADQGDP
jgi:hypothetical protein